MKRKTTAVQKAPTKRTAPARKQSVQTESPVVQGAGGIAQSWSIWSFMGAMDECPPYWSRSRDKWLREFVYRPGNDLLAGVMATAVNKVTATGFVLEGPERTVNLYRDIILRKSEFGAGYAKMIGKDAFDFFSQDAGAYRERIRTSPTDTSGGALGFAHFDSQRCFLTGQSEFPVEYVDVVGAVHKLHFSQVQQYTDLPSPQETMYGVGFCSVSRAITTAHILVDIARYKRERLSDLPPAGILLLNNLEKTKWQDMEKQYSADERNKNNTVWRNVMVAFGMDPAVPATAELFEFSRLPEHFNEPEAIRIAVLSLALAFNMDVNEIWSILGGQMGSGRESDVQHMKAKGKGPGAFLTETERGWNDGLSLPPGIVFQYDFADAEEDQLAAQIADTKAATIRKLWEPSSATGAGIITTDEARQWLQLEGLVTDELMTQGVMADESTADDTEAAKSMIRVDDSPRCKAYSDGRVVRMERKPMAWGGMTLAQPASVYKSVAEVERTYRDTLTHWVYDTMNGRMDALDMRRAHKALVRSVAQDVYFEGMRQGGIENPQDDAETEDMTRIKEWLTGQVAHVDGFASDAALVRDDPTKRPGILARLELWCDSVVSLGAQGEMSAKSNRPGIWHLGDTVEHCKTCAGLNGKRHRVNWFLSRGYVPRQPGNDMLECGGWKCLCFISDAVSGDRIV